MGQPAARLGDKHTCPAATPGLPPISHVGGPILPPCCVTVLIGKQPAARVKDMAFCTASPPAAIMNGSLTVTIGKLPAARVGDPTAHGGKISPPGLKTVLIGG